LRAANRAETDSDKNMGDFDTTGVMLMRKLRLYYVEYPCRKESLANI
jgi:hypothetical protein